MNATSWDVRDGYEVTAVPSMRMVVDLADLTRGDRTASRWVNLTGDSGHAFHPHYTDQSPLWARGETIPMASDAASVRAAAVRTLILRPA